MKTTVKKKNVLAIAILGVACATCAGFGAVQLNTYADSETTGAGTSEKVFAMDDVASLRYNAENPGLRFRVKMDEQTKNAATADGAQLGFVISLTDYVQAAKDGDGKYIDMPAKLDPATIDPEKIYEEEGYYYANAVVTTLAQNYEKAYTAVAYIKTGETYEYADFGRVGGGIQSRTLQEVASKVYFNEPANHADLFDAYPTLGTQTLPILVSESGMNAYANLANLADTADKVFKLTENIIVSEKQNVTLTGDCKAYVADEVFNSAAFNPAQDLYSAGETVDLNNIVGNLTDSALSLDYYVGSTKVEDPSAYAFPESGEYTVKAGYGNVMSQAVTVRVAETKYKEGLIFGGKGAVKNAAIGTGTSQDFPAGVTSITYNEEMKFDASSEGAYLFSITSDENTNVQNAYFGFRAAWNKEYYANAKTNYNYIVARMYIESTPKVESGVAVFDTGASSYMQAQDGQKTGYSSEAGNIGIGGWGMPAGKWFELVIKTGEIRFDGEWLNVFRLNNVGKNAQIKIWIDSVYFANEWENNLDGVTLAVGDKITEKFRMDESAQNSLLFTATRNGEEVSVDNNTVVENDSLYTLSRASKLRVGTQTKSFAFGQPTLATGADADKFSAGKTYGNATENVLEGYEWSVSTETAHVYTGSSASVKYTLNKGNKSTYTDMKLRSALGKTELSQLADLGYEYVTIRMDVNSYSGFVCSSGKYITNVADVSGWNAKRILVTRESQPITTKEYYYEVAHWSNATTYDGWVDVSFKINDIIALADDENLLNLFKFFVRYDGNLDRYSICIDSVKVTKDGVIA